MGSFALIDYLVVYGFSSPCRAVPCVVSTASGGRSEIKPLRLDNGLLIALYRLAEEEPSCNG